jgi:hypothetical protein
VISKGLSKVGAGAGPQSKDDKKEAKKDDKKKEEPKK